MRLRTTALPIFLVTVKPKRGPRAALGRARSACRTKPGRVTFRPRGHRTEIARRLSRSSRAGAAPVRGQARQLLAAAGPAGGDDLAAAGCRHSARGSRAGACARACSVDRCVSSRHLRANSGLGRLIRTGPNQVNARGFGRPRPVPGAMPFGRPFPRVTIVTAASRRRIYHCQRCVARQGAMADEHAPEICVIGGGPGGIALAVAAASRGLPVVLIEKERLGGANLREGGVPSKALLAAAALHEALRRGPAIGVTGAPLQVNFGKVQRASAVGHRSRRPQCLGRAARRARRARHPRRGPLRRPADRGRRRSDDPGADLRDRHRRRAGAADP